MKNKLKNKMIITNCLPDPDSHRDYRERTKNHDAPFVIRLDTLRVFVSAIQVQMQPELERLEDARRENCGRTMRCTVNCRGAGCFRCLFLGHRVSVFVDGFRPRQCRELCRSAQKDQALRR